MKCLSIETSSSACSVALLFDDDIKSLHRVAPMQQSQLILPMIDELLKSADVTLNQLDSLAFGCGPGSFTGVRIATGVVQGLGYALNIPVIPVSSLAALAKTAFDEKGWRHILVAVDARIQEVYWAAYEIDSHGLPRLQGEEKIGKPSEIMTPHHHDWYGAGNAWDVYQTDILSKVKDTWSSCLPTATAVAQIAREKYDLNSWVNASEVQPIYLRNDVAKKAR